MEIEGGNHAGFGAYGPHTTFYSLKGQVEALLRQLNIRPAEIHTKSIPENGGAV